MPHHLAITAQGGYLHAVVTGENTRENVIGYLQELMQECGARQCFRVLVEERLEGPRLGTSDVFEIIAQGSGAAAGVLQAIAFVDVNASGDLMRFAETASINRGLP